MLDLMQLHSSLTLGVLCAVGIVMMADRPTQQTFICMILYLYLSVVFHDKSKNHKYETNIAGKFANCGGANVNKKLT